MEEKRKSQEYDWVEKGLETPEQIFSVGQASVAEYTALPHYVWGAYGVWEVSLAGNRAKTLYVRTTQLLPSSYCQ